MAQTKLTRNQVREIVDVEASFSEKWDRERPEGSPSDADKSVETWLAWMETYLRKAMDSAVLECDKTAALNNLRCVLNLGEICAMYHGLPPRTKDDNKDVY